MAFGDQDAAHDTLYPQTPTAHRSSGQFLVPEPFAADAVRLPMHVDRAGRPGTAHRGRHRDVVAHQVALGDRPAPSTAWREHHLVQVREVQLVAPKVQGSLASRSLSAPRSGALIELADTTWGKVVLWFIAIGLFAYGIFCITEDKYRQAA
jgi:hypothetical protein